MGVFGRSLVLKEQGQMRSQREKRCKDWTLRQPSIVRSRGRASCVNQKGMSRSVGKTRRAASWKPREITSTGRVRSCIRGADGPGETRPRVASWIGALPVSGGLGQNGEMPRDSSGHGSKRPSRVEGSVEGRRQTETEVVDSCAGLPAKRSAIWGWVRWGQ